MSHLVQMTKSLRIVDLGGFVQMLLLGAHLYSSSTHLRPNLSPMLMMPTTVVPTSQNGLTIVVVTGVVLHLQWAFVGSGLASGLASGESVASRVVLGHQLVGLALLNPHVHFVAARKPTHMGLAPVPSLGAKLGTSWCSGIQHAMGLFLLR